METARFRDIYNAIRISRLVIGHPASAISAPDVRSA